MEAIILAGGLGTRLRPMITELPKPMAPIGDKPFLEYILHYVGKYGVKRVILSTGYKHAVIEKYFGRQFKNISLCYSVENEPLGTGGGIIKAFEKVTGENVFILNGDTFFNIDLNVMVEKHIVAEADLTLALKPMKDFNRYGSVVTDGNRVTGFEEKKHRHFGNINGGVYIARAGLFEGYKLPEKFSFEIDFMEKYAQKLMMNAFVSDNYFIDIGVPEDYMTAQKELIKHI